MPERQWKVGDWVELDVPTIEWIGPGFAAQGHVVSAEPGHQVVVQSMDGTQYWRLHNELRTPGDERSMSPSTRSACTPDVGASDV